MRAWSLYQLLADSSFSLPFASNLPSACLSAPAAIQSLPAARDFLAVEHAITEQAIAMLHAYRKHCAANSSPGQLILPESLKLLPLYLSALFKTAAFAVNRLPGLGVSGGAAAAAAARSGWSDVTIRADARIASALYLNSLPPSRLIPHMYPRLYLLHRLEGWVRCRRYIAASARSRLFTLQRHTPSFLLLIQHDSPLLSTAGRSSFRCTPTPHFMLR